MDATRMTVLPTGALKINRVRYNDRGRYTCTAENVFGSVSHDVEIKVLGAGTSVKIKMKQFITGAGQSFNYKSQLTKTLFSQTGAGRRHYNHGGQSSVREGFAHTLRNFTWESTG